MEKEFRHGSNSNFNRLIFIELWSVRIFLIIKIQIIIIERIVEVSLCVHIVNINWKLDILHCFSLIFLIS